MRIHILLCCLLSIWHPSRAHGADSFTYKHLIINQDGNPTISEFAMAGQIQAQPAEKGWLVSISHGKGQFRGNDSTGATLEPSVGAASLVIAGETVLARGLRKENEATPVAIEYLQYLLPLVSLPKPKDGTPPVFCALTPFQVEADNSITAKGLRVTPQPVPGRNQGLQYIRSEEAALAWLIKVQGDTVHALCFNILHAPSEITAWDYLATLLSSLGTGATPTNLPHEIMYVTIQ